MFKPAVGCLVVIALLGCGSPEAATDTSPPSGDAEVRPTGPISDEEFQRKLDQDYGPKQFFKLDELKFADAAHGELARRFDAAARKLAAADWLHDEYNARRSSRSIAATWSSVAGEKRPGVEQRAVEIDVQRDPAEPTDILAIGVTANFAPAGSGWGATVTYFAPHDRVWMEGTRFRIDVRYYPEGEFTWQSPAIALFKDLESIDLKAQFETTEYGVSVAKHPPTSATIADKEVLRWLESADALREQALAKLDALTKRAETEILNGTAIRSAHLIASAAPSRRSAATLALAISDGPQAIPPPESRREMNLEERKKVLADAIAVIEERKELIRENYREMFKALETAFPLRTCLDENRDADQSD